MEEKGEISIQQELKDALKKLYGHLLVPVTNPYPGQQTIDGKQISFALLRSSAIEKSSVDESSGKQAIEGKEEIVFGRSDDFYPPNKKVKSSSMEESSLSIGESKPSCTQAPEPAKEVEIEKLLEPDPCFRDINYDVEDQVFLESIEENKKKRCQELKGDWLGVVDDVSLEEFDASDKLLEFMWWPGVADIPDWCSAFGGWAPWTEDGVPLTEDEILSQGDYYAKLCAFSINKYNKKKRTHYKCVKIVDVTYEVGAGNKYFLTFLAIDDPNNNLNQELQQRSPETFRAEVWSASFWRGGKINFDSCHHCLPSDKSQSQFQH